MNRQIHIPKSRMTPLWTYTVAVGGVEMLVEGERLIMTDTDGNLTVLDRVTGKPELIEKISSGYVSMVFRENLLILPLDEGLLRLDLESLHMQPLHPFAEGTFRAFQPVLVGEHLVIGEVVAESMEEGARECWLYTLDTAWQEQNRLKLPDWACDLTPIRGMGVCAMNEDNTRMLVCRFDQQWQLRELPWMWTGKPIMRVRRVSKRLYVSSAGGPMMVLDKGTLEHVYTLPRGDRVNDAYEGRCYVSNYERMQMRDPDLQEVYTEFCCNIRGSDSNVQGGVCEVGPEMVCFGNNNCHLWCFNRHTGELLEKIEHPDFVIGPPVFAGERLYVNCVDGTITCYDASPYAS